MIGTYYFSYKKTINTTADYYLKNDSGNLKNIIMWQKNIAVD